MQVKLKSKGKGNQSEDRFCEPCRSDEPLEAVKNKCPLWVQEFLVLTDYQILVFLVVSSSCLNHHYFRKSYRNREKRNSVLWPPESLPTPVWFNFVYTKFPSSYWKDSQLPFRKSTSSQNRNRTCYFSQRWKTWAWRSRTKIWSKVMDHWQPTKRSEQNSETMWKSVWAIYLTAVCRWPTGRWRRYQGGRSRLQ